MGNWLGLIVAGLIVWAFTLIPVFPPPWRPFAQALAGILIAIGLLLLVLLLVGVGL